MGGKRRKWTVGVTLGARFLTHYNREQVRTTPPQTLLGEMQLSYFRGTSWSLYLTGGKSVMYAQTLAYGVGFRWPFLTLPGLFGSFISGVSWQLLGDVVRYETAPPDENHEYVDKSFVVRYGGSILWGMGRKGFALETTMLACKISGNFFIAPYAAIQFTF